MTSLMKSYLVQLGSDVASINAILSSFKGLLYTIDSLLIKNITRSGVVESY